jgi:copper transport protein
MSARRAVLLTAAVVVFSALVAPAAIAPPAFAHAMLVAAEPADGAVLPSPPAHLTLRFNEPVGPLVLRLVDPSGGSTALIGAVTRDATLLVPVPPGLNEGTYVFSWRVVSQDGHPVGGTVVFTIGRPSGGAPPSIGGASAPTVRFALWAVKVGLYLGLFVGIGGAFFRGWIAPAGAAPGAVAVVAASTGGLLATPLAVGFQGADALDVPASGLASPMVWKAGLATSFGLTAIAAVCGFLLALFASAAASRRLARGLALAGLVAGGLSLALSGHAATATPPWLMRPTLFAHGAASMIWIGALVPLAAALLAGGEQSRHGLRRFSRAILPVVATLAATGAALAAVQLARVEALWETAYGRVLCIKLGLVLMLLGIAAVNRFLFAPAATKGDKAAVRRLTASIAVECLLVVGILGVVAAWRFTPPPRALAAAAHDALDVHLHGERAMADVTFEPRRGPVRRVTVTVLTGDGVPLAAKEVALVLAHPQAGIEPVRRTAIPAGNATWRIDRLEVPVAGTWRVRVEILVNDFERVAIEREVELAR